MMSVIPFAPPTGVVEEGEEQDDTRIRLRREGGNGEARECDGAPMLISV
jgi:hypothetical protein